MVCLIPYTQNMRIWVVNHLSPKIWTMPKSNVWVVHKMASAARSQSCSGGVGVETWTPCTGVQYSVQCAVHRTGFVPSRSCLQTEEGARHLALVQQVAWPCTQGLRSPGTRGQGVVWSYLLGIICIWIICNASLKSTFTFTHRSEQHTQWTWHEKI